LYPTCIRTAGITGRLIMRPWIIALGFTMVAQCPLAAAELNADAINAANYTGTLPTESKLSPLAVKVQVLLDRAHFSPGEIDGLFGDNVEKALQAYTEANNITAGKTLTAEIWTKLQANAADAVTTEYVLTEQDVKGPYIGRLPVKMEDMKSLKSLGYVNAKEALSERFHMSQDLLEELNPNQKFDRAGDRIVVVNVGQPATAKAEPTKARISTDTTSGNKVSRKQASEEKAASAKAKDASQVSRVDVDKTRQTVKAFAKDGTLLAFHPASVGSEEKPTPSGMLKVTSVHANPTYRYDPKYKFKGVESTKPFTIEGGPNNPVGVMWIGLSQASYGIHGTSDPSRVSKSDSHGCVRLTNWDVERLGAMVKKGVEVQFIDGKQALK
jgi:lipoprotein-anchoring transpeptidase ErfK/SrfK